jgi:hypothetical protein
LAEWIIENGIGETRAALIADGRIIETRIEREDAGVRAGAVVAARIGRALRDTNRAEVMLDGDIPALLRPIPKSVSEGAAIHVAVLREAIPEPGNPKPAVVRLALPEEAASPGMALADRIAASGHPVTRLVAHQPDVLEAAGWSEVLAEAESGLIPFPGGLLRLSLTTAMTLFDIDGGLPGPDLARAGAAAAAAAIRRLDIGGSIGLDLPDAGSKAGRQAAAAAIDAILPPPFERTAVNGFGFLQIVRPRPRASLPELLHADPVLAAALALLRRAERTQGIGPRTLSAHPAVIARIAARPDWLAALARRMGAEPVLRERPGAAISAGDVHASTPPPR